MNAYTLTVIIVLLCSSLADELPYDDYLNVGTVLFSHSDLTRSHWNKFNIALLQARQYFQTVIPPPNYIDVNKDYVNKLLNYFRAAYSSIKNDSEDPELHLILTKALSDTIGGYLKQWILPITKLAFYCGTINCENANKLMTFYNEIKKYLDTDGAGWTQPDIKLMSIIPIAIVPPPRMKHSKTNVDPCKEFAYLETTIDGLTIPMPYIDWQEKTMFVPLKDFPLIALNSPKHSLALAKYYDAAKSCLDSKNPNGTAAFEKRFQTWLNIDVLPHLSDNTLYVALGSILGLANITQALSSTVIHMFKYLPQEEELYISSSAINGCTRKTVIIGIILLIEIIWCVIALRHACTRKDKSPGGCCSDVFMYFKADKNNWDSKQTSRVSIKQYPGSWSEIRGGGIKFHRKPKKFNKQYDFGVQHPSTIVLTRHTAGTNTRSSELMKINKKRRGAKPFIKIIDETSQHTKISQTEYDTEMQPKRIPRLVSKNKVPVQVSSFDNNAPQHPHCNCGGCPACSSNYIDTNTNLDASNITNSNTNASNTVSFITVQEMHPSKTVTLFKRNQRSIERAICDSEDNTILIRKAVSERTSGLVLDTMCREFSHSQSECECVCCDAESICPCSSSQSKVQTDVKEEQVHSPEASFGECSCHSIFIKTPDPPPEQHKIIETIAEEVVMSIDKEDASQVKNIQKATKIETIKEFTITRHKDSYSGGQPFVEIKIDRPNAEISVGISAVAHSSRRSDKSKIPKRALTPTRKKDKSANHSDLSDEALKLNDQIIDEAVRSYRKYSDKVESKPIDNDELTRYNAMGTSYNEKMKAKDKRKASRKKDSRSRTTSRLEELSDVPLENIEQIIYKTQKYKTKVPIKESNISSKVIGRSGNRTKEKTMKLDRNMYNDSNKTKNPDVDIISKATVKDRTGDIEDNIQIKKPGNVICIYKNSIASTPKVNRKSLIPHLKKNTADDATIISKRATVKDSKLNITL